jgi:hypothetical protein
MTKTDKQVYTYVNKTVTIFQNERHAIQVISSLKEKYELNAKQIQYVNNTINKLRR